jgi:hypothetical protein
MRFRSRPLHPDDLNECLDILSRRSGYQELLSRPRTRDAVHAGLRNLLTSAAATARAVDSPDLPEGQRIVTWGVTVFVRTGWLEAFLRDPYPHFGAQHLMRCATGLPSDVMLNEDEVASANGRSGLHALTVAAHWDVERVPEPHTLAHLQASVGAYLDAHRGYRLVELVNECRSGPEAGFFIGSGAWSVRSRYDRFYARTGTTPPDAAAPILVGRTKQEAEEMPNASAVTATLFVWREPRYGFSRDQQALLLMASEYASDRELGARLGLKHDALRRRWNRIFKRVEARQLADDPIFPPATDTSGKRARLLRRLMNEPHELRPYQRTGRLRARERRPHER